VKVRRQVSLERCVVDEREFLGVLFEEKIEGVYHGHLGYEVDRETKLRCPASGKRAWPEVPKTDPAAN